MRFKNYLQEQSTGMSYDEVVQAIASNCKPYLEANPELPIFRGVSKRYMRAGYTPHPESRPARDSGMEFNFTFNTGFHLAHGVPSIRTRSVFATGDALATSEYGELGFFFPAGDFKFAWSDKFADSYTDEDKLERILGKNFLTLTPTDIFIPGNVGARVTELINFIQEEISPIHWIRNIDDEGEDETLKAAKHANFPPIPNLHTILTEALRLTFMQLYNNNVDLTEAVRSKHEILFYQTGGYWMVPYSMVQEAMNEAGMEGTHYNRQERYDFLMEHIKKFL